MTDDAAEASFREAVGREGSLVRLGRALSLSDRGSFHLLDVVTPRTLRAAVPVVVGAMGGGELTRVRVTLEQMSSRDGLTAAVFAALSATETAATPLLIDASAALPSETEVWTWCFHRWNERRDRVAAERTAPVVLAAAPWLVVLLAKSAPDLWSVRGPSARVDVAPPPAIAMIDRVQVSSIIELQPRSAVRPSQRSIREALSHLRRHSGGELLKASLLIIREADELHRAWEFNRSLDLRQLAVSGLERAHEEDPDSEEGRLFYASALVSLGELQRQRETFQEALVSDSKAASLLTSRNLSEPWNDVSLLLTAMAILQTGTALILLDDAEVARNLMRLNAPLFAGLPSHMSFRDMLTVNNLITSLRASTFTGQYREATVAAVDLKSRLEAGLFPAENDFSLGALTEFYLDRGDNDRVLELSLIVRATKLPAHISIGVARCALGADAVEVASDLLSWVLLSIKQAYAPSMSPYAGWLADTYVLGAEVARALHDDALTHQYVTLARAALDDLQQRDPTSPRCIRLLARFAEQRVAPRGDGHA